MSGSTFKHILVPHDFSETASAALAYALDLAAKLGARVTVLHVYDAVGYGFPEGWALTAEVAGQIEAAASQALDGVVERARKSGVTVDRVLRQGPAWSEIEGFARAANVDLIVMGTHGRRGLSRVLLGSVAERVVRVSPCPVLTVHGPSGK